MKLKTLMELAEHHESISGNAKSNRHFNDALEYKMDGDFCAARRAALRCLECAIGREHPDYQRAAAGKGERV